MAAKPKTPRPVKAEKLLIFYDAHLRETNHAKIAAVIGLSKDGYDKKVARHPELQMARRMAEEKRAKTHTLEDYVLHNLSPEARAVWEEIQFWDDARGKLDKINDILEGRTVRLKQEIFIQALISRGYNNSEACRLSGVSRNTVDGWKRNDMHFLQLLEEIEVHKCDFFEQSLVDLVAEGNPAAVMFANRTKNAHRGYNEKLTVEHGGQVGVSFNIEQLDLSIECRKELLNAIREQKKAAEVANENRKAIDVQSSAVEA